MSDQLSREDERAYKETMHQVREITRGNTVPNDVFLQGLIPGTLASKLGELQIYAPVKYRFGTLVAASSIMNHINHYWKNYEFPEEHELLSSIVTLSDDLRRTIQEISYDSQLSEDLRAQLESLGEPGLVNGAMVDWSDGPRGEQITLDAFDDLESGSLAEYALTNSVSVDELMLAQASRWNKHYRSLYSLIAQLCFIETMMEMTRHFGQISNRFGLKTSKPRLQPLSHRAWAINKRSIITPLVHLFHLGLTPGVPFASLMRKIQDILPEILTRLSEHKSFNEFFTYEAQLEASEALKERFIEDFVSDFEVFDVLSEL